MTAREQVKHTRTTCLEEYLLKTPAIPPTDFYLVIWPQKDPSELFLQSQIRTDLVPSVKDSTAAPKLTLREHAMSVTWWRIGAAFETVRQLG
jgi:hypothetical protein